MRRSLRLVCPMRPPDDLLTPNSDTDSTPMHDLPEKYTHPSSYQNHSHDRSFSLNAQTATDEHMGTVVASQFPSRCERLLLFEDDLAGQGLGATAHFMAVALLIAMRTGRVLLEVAVNPRWGRTNMSIPYRRSSAGASTPTLPAARPRWCSRPPYTHQCFYLPWSNCTAGNTTEHQSPRLGRFNGLIGHALLPGRTPIVRIKLSGLYISTGLHAGVMTPAYAAATRFLFRPREWVKHLGRCVLRRDGLAPHSFISVFIRESAEKNTEARQFKYKMPVVDDYAASAEALSRAIHMQRVHIQTSSAVALANFTVLTSSLRLAARGVPLTLSYTDNPRSEHDTWGGWGKDKDETVDGTVAAVNAFMARHAAVLIAPRLSSWTTFLLILHQWLNVSSLVAPAAVLSKPQGGSSRDSEVHRTSNTRGGQRITRDEKSRAVHLCCQCRRRDKGSNLVVVMGLALGRRWAVRNATLPCATATAPAHSVRNWSAVQRSATARRRGRVPRSG